MTKSDPKPQPKVTVGIISYKDKHYLEKALPSLLNQDYPNMEIIICDNTPEKETTDWIKNSFPEIKAIDAGGNVGFARAHNKMIDLAIQGNSDYYLAFNSDMYASHNYISKLVSYFQKNTNIKLGCITPKLLQWKNFPESPDKIITNTYDTTGINGSISHHFKERGHNQPDQEQYSNKKQVWGSSGASPMFSIHALQDIQHQQGEYFDSNFFMYKEDIDLSYRLRWAGYEIHYAPDSIAWHDRTGSDPGGIVKQVNERKKRANYIKENSFLNHLQFTYKNWSPQYSLKTKFKTGIYLSKYILYLLFFDPKILKQFKKFQQLKPEILKKRQTMPRRISSKTMEQYLSNNFSQS